MNTNYILSDDHVDFIDTLRKYQQDYWLVRWFRDTKGRVLFFRYNRECGGL
jgi:hypothetical protein